MASGPRSVHGKTPNEGSPRSSAVAVAGISLMSITEGVARATGVATRGVAPGADASPRRGDRMTPEKGIFMSMSSRGASLRTRVAVVAAASVAVAGLGAGLGATPASADVHRGVNGCFSWSWGDGNTSVTVYWHNRCKSKHKLNIKYSLGWTTKKYTAVVGADGKGHKKFQTASIVSITDGGAA